MKLLVEHKNHLISVSIIFLLFIGSIFLRQDELSKPLSSSGEWITAHTLITCEIWAKNGGPSNYQFSPVYTYPGEGSKAIAAFGGVMDVNRDQYYVSYPPFAFIYAYYATQILGSPDVYTLRVSNLILHFFCSFFLYLIVRQLSKNNEKLHIAPITGAALYLFSTGTLWMHGMLYFSDMLVQLFLMISIYLFIRLIQKDYKKEYLLFLMLFGSIFLGSYTEWLGLFWAFFSGIGLMIYYLKTKRTELLKGFFITALASLAALVTTIVQFSSIAGFDRLKEVSQEKYAVRSGHAQESQEIMQFTVNDQESWDLMFTYFEQNFSMVLDLVILVLFIGLPFVIWKRNYRKLDPFKNISVMVLAVLSLSIGLHYYLFFNFNAIHNFSNLKTGFFLILVISAIILMLERSVKTAGKLLIAFFLIGIGSIQMAQDHKQYVDVYVNRKLDSNRDHTAEIIQKYHDPNRYVFLNIPSSAELLYQSKHIVFPVSDSTAIPISMQYFNSKSAQYYHHEGDTLKYMVNLKMTGDEILVENCTQF